MKSMFAPASFGRSQMGIVSLRRPMALARGPVARYGPPAMGQDFLEDILDDIGLSDIENITEELDQLLTEVPIGTVKESYQKRRDECMDKSIISKYTCLYDLFQDIKRDLKDKDEGVPPKPPTVTPTPKKKENGIPILPIAVGGVVLAIIVYALVR